MSVLTRQILNTYIEVDFAKFEAPKFKCKLANFGIKQQSHGQLKS